ncbi:MAG: hypothetical protein FJY16_01160 [Bacteroidetes bacterium]|nr:hypothetical protein [Bacteroidota bacterium]
MQKLSFAIVLMLMHHLSFAQEPADMLRMAWADPTGTARQQAIGGAMVSLGGDLTAAFTNPAGLAFYRSGDFVFTPSFTRLNNSATFKNTTTASKRSALGLGLTGFVAASPTDNRKGSAAVAIALNRTGWFGNNLLYRGLNTTHSYSQKYLEEIAGVGDANLVASKYPFGSSLAFNTYWIDTIAGGSNGNFRYQSRASIGTGLIQENEIASKGGISELAIAVAGSRQEKFFYGLTLGIPFLQFERTTTFTEADPTKALNNFNYATYQESLQTSGSGINVKMGLIYRPVSQWRIGLSIHTPTFLRLTDKYNASITTDTENYKGVLTQSSKAFTNGEDAEYSYLHFTPFRAMAGLSFVIREVEDVSKQKGFVTADVEWVNYPSAAFKADPSLSDATEEKAYYKKLNTVIDAAYRSALNLRMGGELKFTTWMARAGMAYLGNPYNNIRGEEGNRLQYTGGIGYRDKGYFIDLAYIRTMGKDIHAPYRLSQQAFDLARIQQRGTRLLLTLGIKF